jgi:hypothetical protein
MALTDQEVSQRLNRVMNRLAKWRTLFAGWQLGTRAKEDPELQAVKHHRELSIFLRAEASTLTGLLIRKGVFTQREFEEALIDEAELLDRDYSERFPGVRSDDKGLVFDQRAVETMRGWKP